MPKFKSVANQKKRKKNDRPLIIIVCPTLEIDFPHMNATSPHLCISEKPVDPFEKMYIISETKLNIQGLELKNCLRGKFKRKKNRAHENVSPFF